MNKITVIALKVTLLVGCRSGSSHGFDQDLDYCLKQASKTVAGLHDSPLMPRSIANGAKAWRLVNYRDWTSGFWPGILWYAYEYSGDDKWKELAQRSSAALFPLVDSAAIDHDLGFQMLCSIGQGYRLTGDTAYKTTLLRAADTLSRLFSPRVGTILSWPRQVPGTDWPLRHNTIMDNMINLELLFWAARNGCNRKLYDMALSHARTTMLNHFRSDYSSFHVVVYDTASGRKIRGFTHQGFSDSSMWARGQAWAIYGYTMVARETGQKIFLDFAQRVTEVYLEKLPEDLIPFWDFDDPAIPDAPKDASAACVVASALLELSTLVENRKKASSYYEKAVLMLENLSNRYLSLEINPAFLVHATGHKPAGSEIDASIIYADYYYIEALVRAKKLKEGKRISDRLQELSR